MLSIKNCKIRHRLDHTVETHKVASNFVNPKGLVRILNVKHTCYYFYFL